MNQKEKNEAKKDEEELIKNPVNNFCCGVCAKKDVMNLSEFKNHLLEVHNLQSDQIKGKKQMVMHMDGTYWYSSNYEWELENGLKFSQFTKNARRKDDFMRAGY